MTLCRDCLNHKYPAQRMSILILSQTELGVHANNAAHEIPIPIQANPVRNKNACRAVIIMILTTTTNVIHNSRIHLPSHFFRPGIRFPEITSTQEVDVKRERLGRVRVGLNTKGIATATGTIDMLRNVLDLLLDVHAFQHLIEVLNAKLPTGTHCMRSVIRPRRGINAPSIPAMLALQILW